MIIKLELHITDAGTFLNFWDAEHGRDVVVEIVRGKIIHGERAITISEWVARVTTAARSES